MAYSIGAVRVLSAHRSEGRATAPAAPMPPVIMEAFEDADERFLEADWHVVFKGKTPGVYPAWYVYKIRCFIELN